MKKLIDKLMLFYVTTEKEIGEDVKITIRTIVKLSDAEKESFTSYASYCWIEYAKSIITESYTHAELTPVVYNAWLEYRKGL